MRTLSMVLLALAVVTLGPLGAPAAEAKTAKKPKERYFVTITKVYTAEGAPEAIAEVAKNTLVEIISKRPEFILTLEGAPDRSDAPKFSAWLRKKKIKAYDVELKLTVYTREVTPQPEKKGQILAVKIAVEINGSSVPDGSWAMTGDGSAQMAAEVGKKISEATEKNVLRETMVGALTMAVDRAVYKLQNQKPPPLKK
jgi:hypothetical protein